MFQPRIGVQLASLRQPFRYALQTVSRLGARGVEIDARTEVRPQEMSRTGLRHLRKLLNEMNLQVSAVDFPTRRGYDEPDDLERRVAATQAAMHLAYQIGASVVTNTIGRIPEDPESPRWRTLCEALSQLGSHGQRVGALLAVRTGADRGSDLARLLAALPEGVIGVDLDPGNLIAHGHSALEAVAAVGPWIRHVHASDAVSDPSPGRSPKVALGRGSADFAALLPALDQHGYRGWFTVVGRDGPDPAAEIGAAVQYLDNLVRS